MEFLVFSSFPRQTFHLNCLDNIFGLGIEGENGRNSEPGNRKRKVFFPHSQIFQLNLNILEPLNHNTAGQAFQSKSTNASKAQLNKLPAILILFCL